MSNTEEIARLPDLAKAMMDERLSSEVKAAAAALIAGMKLNCDVILDDVKDECCKGVWK